MKNMNKRTTGKTRICAVFMIIVMVFGLIPAPMTALRARAAFSDVTETLELGLKGTRGAEVTYQVKNKVDAPADTSYVLDASTNVDGASVSASGELKFKVGEGNNNDTYVIKVNVTSTAEGIKSYTLNIKLNQETPYKTAIVTSGAADYGVFLKNVPIYGTFVDYLGNTVAGKLTWDKPDDVPKNGDQKDWTFIPNDSYYAQKKDKATINSLRKATPIVGTPQVADITYDPTKPLKSLSLKTANAVCSVGGKSVTVSGKWEFQNPETIPTVNNNGYIAIFKPTDAANFSEVSARVYIVVKKAVPKFTTKPTISAINLGQSLESALFTGYVANCAGTIQWENKSIRPTVADSGKTKYNYYYIPTDTVNFEILTDSATVTVNKKTDAPNTPKNMYVGKGCKTVSDVGLPANWKWNAKDASKTIGENAGDTVVATAEYTGSDKDNYQNITKPIILTKSDCYHSAIEYRYAKNATCEEHGYQGDKYCKACRQFVGNGELTDPLGHNYISSIVTKPTATSAGKRKYTCTRYNCREYYYENILATSDNNAGFIYLRPALYENITTAAVTLSQADIDTAAESSLNKIITVHVTPMSGGKTTAAERTSVTLSTEVQNSLIQKGILQTKVCTPDAEVAFNLSAISAMKDKATGDVTLSMKRTERVDGRPYLEMNLTKEDGTEIEDLGTNGIIIRIPYVKQLVNSSGEVTTSGNLEQTSKIRGYYKDSADKVSIIENSYYDEGSCCVVIPTSHLSGYGVGYKISTPVNKKLNLKGKASKTSIKLSWSKVTGATSYVVYGKGASGSYKKLKTVTGTTFTHKKLKKGKNYYYYVKAMKGKKTISTSAKIKVKTKK